MYTELIGTIIFFIIYVIAAVAITWYVNKNTEQEEYKSSHAW